MTETILVLQPISEELKDIIRQELPPGFTLDTTTSPDPAHLATKLATADYCVFWDIGLPPDLLSNAPQLKLAHKWGVGVENIDLPTARQRGIKVARTTGGNAIPVGEFAVALMLATGRRIVNAHNSMVAGQWAKNDIWRQAILLSNKTVGIVGLGAIGKQVAKRVAGFGCTILYNNRNQLPPDQEAALGVAYRDMPSIIAESDFLCLTCPLTPETRGMIARPQLESMKPTAILINVIVVEEDLVHALTHGTIAAAAVDVFEPEPPSPTNPLLHLPNCVVTPHCASTAFETSRTGIRHWLRNIQLVAAGQPIPEIDAVP
jgi:phosphoglycerate dehydrogenase-like enzyme